MTGPNPRAPAVAASILNHDFQGKTSTMKILDKKKYCDLLSVHHLIAEVDPGSSHCRSVT